jgi:hypothetical protein
MVSSQTGWTEGACVVGDDKASGADDIGGFAANSWFVCGGGVFSPGRSDTDARRHCGRYRRLRTQTTCLGAQRPCRITLNADSVLLTESITEPVAAQH